jgi:nucleoside-diphosphate-sugar epimerase
MTILLTGGAGFIGSNLSEKLIEQGHSVVCLDNFDDFYDINIKHTNIKPAFS